MNVNHEILNNTIILWIPPILVNKFEKLKKHPIYPLLRNEWDFSSILNLIHCLLCHKYYKIPLRFRENQIIEILLINEKTESYKIWLDLKNNYYRVHVKNEEIKNYNVLKFYKYCQTDKWGRKRNEYQNLEFISLYREINNKNYLFYRIQFSFINICKSLKKVLINDSNLKFLDQFFSYNLSLINFKAFNDINDIMSFFIGSLTIFVSLNKTNNKQFSIRYNHEEMYVNQIIWISPYVKSIILDNYISCIEWDSTFKSARPYTLCIPMAIYKNVGIPLGFIIGVSENSHLYQQIFDELCKTINININYIPCLSDFGSSIKSFCESKNIIQYFCHRHLLEIIGSNSAIIPVVSKIIECDNTISLNSNLIHCSSYLLKLMEIGIKQSLINDILGKIGMQFIDGTIIIINEHIFNSISMIQRKNLGIPSSTNHIESSHGHINRITPRKRNFFTTLNRLVGFCIRKSENVDYCVRKNIKKKERFNNYYMKITPPEIIQEECRIYRTNRLNCLCGKSYNNILFYGISIPCLHQAFIGETINYSLNKNVEMILLKNSSINIVIENDGRFFFPNKKNQKKRKQTRLKINAEIISLKIIEDISNKIYSFTSNISLNEISRYVIKNYPIVITGDICYDNISELFFISLFDVMNNKINNDYLFFVHNFYLF